MANYYLDHAARLRDKRDTEHTDAYLAKAGFDESGNPVNAFPISDRDDTDGRIFLLDRHTSRNESTSFSVVAALSGEADDITAQSSRNEASDCANAIFDDTLGNGEDVEAISRVAADTQARALAYHNEGDVERAAEEAKHAVALHALVQRNRARETLKVRDLSTNRAFTDAVLVGDLHKANDIMVAVVRDTEAPYALRVACIGGIQQIAKYVGTDNGDAFNDAWLSRITRLARSTCKELMDAQWRVGTDLAMLMLGTESDARKGFREWGAMTLERRNEAIADLKAFHTASMIAHAEDCEQVARARKISQSELLVLTAVGMNCEEGWKRLTTLPLKKAQVWLAKMLDETHCAADRTGGIVATAKSAAALNESKLVKSASDVVPTKRLLTQRQLDAGNVRELGDV